MQDPPRVALQLRNSNHGGILPDDELVLGKSVSRDELLVVEAPLQGADLRARVDRVQADAAGGVPEADMAICRSSAGGEEVRLERRPRQRLNGCLSKR